MGQIDVAEFKAFVTRHNYTWWTQGAEKAWFLIEGKTALDSGLYIAALLCYVIGIEACLRTTLLYHLGGTENDDLNNTTQLSNTLLRDCKAIGLNIELLAFPAETDFLNKITTNKPHVEIVALRHNITHGNFMRFYGANSTGRRTFEPSYVKDTAIQVQELADAFVMELKRFMDHQMATRA